MRRNQHCRAAFCVCLLLYSPLRVSIIPLFSIFCVRADQINITVDDTSPDILYLPASSWHSSGIPCSTCLDPGPSIAWNGTWHDGTHIIPDADADDSPTSASAASLSTSRSPLPSSTSTTGKEGDDDDHDHDADDEQKNKHGHRRRLPSVPPMTLNPFRRQACNDTDPFCVSKFDGDDPQFVDTPVTAQFNFTGSAIYIYSILPLGLAQANTTPTYMNLTYTLDSQPAGSFQHNGTASASGFEPAVAVFAKPGLANGPHTLTVNVGPDSVFLLDYIVYTRNNDSGTDGGISPSGSVSAPAQATNTGSLGPSASAASSNRSASSKSHDVATFAGAVGGSIGFLAVLALSLFVSIYRRRTLAARRDRRSRGVQHRRSDGNFDAESFHTEASEDGPPMQGPAPFVPRYFPGTIVPVAPPPYVAGGSPSEATASLLGSTSPVLSPSSPWPPRYGHGDGAYADRPPPTPPPMNLDDAGYFAPPPPFPVAIASPIPAILANLTSSPLTALSSSPSPTPMQSSDGDGNLSESNAAPSTGSRPRSHSDARSHWSQNSDRPPSFASQAPASLQSETPQTERDVQREVGSDRDA